MFFFSSLLNSYEKHFGGKKYTIELKENGKNIDVDETNKREYV